MANEDKLSFLEQLSNALVGQTVTGGAKALGAGIGYGYGGGDFGDIPQIMREELERHKLKSANQTKNEQDALAVASGLAAMSNPISAVGHGIDFAAAVPEMIKYKLSDAEPPLGMIAETGLKRRLAKGGAAAEYATQNSLQRSNAILRNQGMVSPKEQFMLIESPADKWPFGAGKFQSVNDYKTKAFDLSRMSDQGRPIPMGNNANNYYVISARPHELGVEFSNTHGLKPQYRGKAYGQEIYQNMADVYGGGISDSGSTSDAARRVYDALGAIDTGIPSGGGTRMALPTREMKSNPEAMAAFEAKVKEYADKQGIMKRLPIEVEDTGLQGEQAYLAWKPETHYAEYGSTPEEAKRNLLNQIPIGSNRVIRRVSGTNADNILNHVENRLANQSKNEVIINGHDVNDAFMSFDDFRKFMRENGYNAEYSGMANAWFVRKRQP